MSDHVTEITPKSEGRILTPRRMILVATMASLGLLNAGCLQAVQGAFRMAGEILNGVGEIAEPVMASIEAFQNGDVAGGVGNILGAVGAGGNVVGRVAEGIGGLAENGPRVQEAGPVRAGEGLAMPQPERFVPGAPARTVDPTKTGAEFRNDTAAVPAPGPFKMPENVLPADQFPILSRARAQLDAPPAPAPTPTPFFEKAPDGSTIRFQPQAATLDPGGK